MNQQKFVFVRRRLCLHVRSGTKKYGTGFLNSYLNFEVFRIQ